MTGHEILQKAKREKNDEFYTQYEDIEKELQHYKKHFKGKTVYSSCDDPVYSEFCNYFLDHFHDLGLKRYICSGMGIGERRGRGYVLDATGEMEPEIKELEGDGSFDSEECIELLKEADVVVTNPPFSLFREYVAQLVEYDKKFLIIGNINSVGCRDIFPLFMQNKCWLGVSIHSGDRVFNVPDSYQLEAAGCGIDKSGKRYIRVKGVRWYTNIDIEKRHEDLILFRHYDPAVYPKYDNYDAIEVSKTCDIPCDYDGYMGVPITFMDKYSPEQFELVGRIRPEINGQYKYTRIIIKRKAA